MYKVVLRVHLCLTCVGILLSAGSAVADPVSIDSNHSTVEFSVPILGGLSAVTGKFMEFEVEFDMDPKDFTKSKIRAVIQSKSVDTGVTQRDAHLRGRDFFHIRDFPEIVFASKSISKTDDGYLVTGDLTIRGNTHEVELPLRVTGTYKNPKSGRSNIGFEAHTVINRDDFEVSYRHDNPYFIGTDIEIRLHIVSRSLDFEPGKL